MKQEILISIDEREGRAVLLEEGRLMEVLVAREDSQVGRVYKGRVENVFAGMNAAFVDIGLERNGFLCADDASSHLQDLDSPPAAMTRRRITDIAKKGQDALVQIVKEVIGTKGARLSTNISLPGRYFVVLPTIPACHVGVSRKITGNEERERLYALAREIVAEKCAVIVRTAAEGCERHELESDWQSLWATWEDIRAKSKSYPVPSLLYSGTDLINKVMRDLLTDKCVSVQIDSRREYERLKGLVEVVAPQLSERIHLYSENVPLFVKYDIETAIDKALHRKVRLKSGGNLVVERTEALWAIDVNTAQNVDRDAILATNLEACREVCRQMRLRDMGGIIIVDFINMESPEEQSELLECLSEELKRDRVRTKLVGITELGLVQITRKREGKDLDRILREPCRFCYGSGRVISARSTALKARRELLRLWRLKGKASFAIHLNPRAAWKFVGEKGELAAELARDTGCVLRVVAEEGFMPSEFSVIPSEGAAAQEPGLSAGQQGYVKLFPSYGSDKESCLGVLEGHLLVVSDGAEHCGSECAVRVTEAGEYISRAQLVRL